ncbi:hypothetical protein [Senegalia massiliensis]|uniref:Uncharacterized protein n=1 Tax=Senegalia massiliensis TaxID=1720316 RepID=A0A845QZ56_9CLOT|nr:hypothetical protein [Senegalia massiliensis]NBI07591.1 hypothetical protein [Senegalia massiliensis]
MKILFGLNQSANNDIEEQIKKAYYEMTEKTFEYKSEYYFGGIWEELKNEYNILILKEDLEDNSIPKSDLDELTDVYKDLKIIYIVNDAHKNDDYIKYVFNLGIYNVLYKSDLTLRNIVELIEKNRSKKDAKIYMDITEVEILDSENANIVKDRELQTIIINLTNDLNTSEEVFLNSYVEIQDQYNDQQNLYLLTKLPKEIMEKLLNSDNEYFHMHYKRYKILNGEYEKEDDENKKSNTNRNIKTFFSTKDGEKNKVKTNTVTKTITKIEKEYIRDLPKDYKKIVGFVGNRKVGTTTIIDLIAKTLAKEGKKVSVLDITNNQTLFYIKCWGDESITDYQKNSLRFLEEGENHSIKIDENYNLYTMVGNSKKEQYKFDFYNAIETIRYDNDVILIDLNFKSNYQWLKYGVSDLYVVNDLNVINMIETKDYIKTLVKSGVNEKKIKLIVNKYINSKVNEKDILATLTDPILDLENDDSNNKLSINANIFKVDFEVDNYIKLLNSYLIMDNEVKIDSKIVEQIKVICNEIHHISESKKKFNIKKLIPFVK